MGKDPDRPAPPASLEDGNIEQVFAQFGDLFRDLFDVAGHATSANGDVMMTLRVTRERAAHGGVESLEVPTDTCDACTGEPCKACSGRGHREQTHGFFLIENLCERCVRGVVRPPACPSCLGTGVVHSNVEIVLPPGVASGHVIRMAGRGAPRDDGAGDLHVHIIVEDIELPRASVRRPAPPVWPFAVALAGVIAAAAAASIFF